MGKSFTPSITQTSLHCGQSLTSIHIENISNTKILQVIYIQIKATSKETVTALIVENPNNIGDGLL